MATQRESRNDLCKAISKELEQAGFPPMGDLHQAAAALQRCYHTIWRAARSGALRVVRPGGPRGRMLVRRADLAAYVTGNGSPARPQLSGVSGST